MLKAKQIPKEVRDAFYDAYWHDDAADEDAIAAAINAWPGMEKGKHYSGQGRPGVRAIILPIQETNE